MDEYFTNEMTQSKHLKRLIKRHSPKLLGLSYRLDGSKNLLLMRLLGIPTIKADKN